MFDTMVSFAKTENINNVPFAPNRTALHWKSTILSCQVTTRISLSSDSAIFLKIASLAI
jgi:hypothetical protein